jgi:hypothetical protein
VVRGSEQPLIRAGATRALRGVLVPRRLLVSPDGVAHDPTCRRVPSTAESGLWGEICLVQHALELLAGGESVSSTRHGTVAGPCARLSRACLSPLPAARHRPDRVVPLDGRSGYARALTYR